MTTKTLAEQIAAADKAHADQIAKLTTEHAAREALGVVVPGIAAYAAPTIHVYPLYGRAGSICFKAERAACLREKGKREPDRELVALLMAALPAVPLTKFKDGCLSFRPTSSVDAMPDEKLERVDLTPVAPWLLQADPNHFSDRVKVEWYAELDGGLWEIEIEFPRYACKIGTWDLVVKRDNYGDVVRVERCDLRLHGGSWNEAPEPPQLVRWAKGDPKSLNNFTLWWFDPVEEDGRAHIQRGILAALPAGKAADHV